MKFAIISDIHIGEEEEFKGVIRKMSRFSMTFINDFINKMNNETKPTLVFNLGDAINDIDRNTDINNLKLAFETLKKLNCPVYNLVGNHEQRTIEVEELEKLYDHKPLYYSFDHQDYHFIILFSDDYERRGPLIPDDQKTWLEKDLNKTKKDTIVFVHHSLADQDLTGNFWFEGRPERSLIKNREEVRSILENSKKVRAVFNGHLHWNELDVHKQIPYFNIQSLVENFKNEDIPSGSYAIVEITEDLIKVDIKGLDAQEYSYKRGSDMA